MQVICTRDSTKVLKASLCLSRCQVDVCHNYCLNNGICNVSTAFEALKCQCPPGFSGSRCQQPEPEIAIPTTFNYEHAFLVSSSLCVVFIFILLAACIILLRKKQEKGPDFARFEKISKEPEIVKKNGRTRVFSTSSNSDGKRLVIFSSHFKLSVNRLNDCKVVK